MERIGVDRRERELPDLLQRAIRGPADHIPTEGHDDGTSAEPDNCNNERTSDDSNGQTFNPALTSIRAAAHLDAASDDIHNNNAAAGQNRPTKKIATRFSNTIAAAVSTPGVTTTLLPILAYAMNYLTTPIPKDDPASRTLKALRVSQLNTQLALQQCTLEAAVRDARWQETMTNERLRHTPRRPRALINNLVARGREQGVGFDEPATEALPPTPAHGLQAAVALVDML